MTFTGGMSYFLPFPFRSFRELLLERLGVKGAGLAPRCSPENAARLLCPATAPLPRRVVARLLTWQAGNPAPQHLWVHILDY